MAVHAPRLSPREQLILRLIAEGSPRKAIANDLGISERTVDSHLARIGQKLGITDRVLLARYALQQGLVESSQTRDRPVNSSDNDQGTPERAVPLRLLSISQVSEGRILWHFTEATGRRYYYAHRNSC